MLPLASAGQFPATWSRPWWLGIDPWLLMEANSESAFFWDTLYIYLKWVWSVRREFPKVQKSHCVHSNLTKAEKTAGCVCLCLCLSFCLRLNLCLCLWLLPKTQKRNCTSYTLANVDNELSVFVFFLVWSFVFVFVTHQKCKRATVCTPPWPRQDKQLSRKYKLTNRPTIFSSERVTLDRVIFRVIFYEYEMCISLWPRPTTV